MTKIMNARNHAAITTDTAARMNAALSSLDWTVSLKLVFSRTGAGHYAAIVKGDDELVRGGFGLDADSAIRGLLSKLPGNAALDRFAMKRQHTCLAEPIGAGASEWINSLPDRMGEGDTLELFWNGCDCTAVMMDHEMNRVTQRSHLFQSMDDAVMDLHRTMNR